VGIIINRTIGELAILAVLGTVGERTSTFDTPLMKTLRQIDNVKGYIRKKSADES